VSDVERLRKAREEVFKLAARVIPGFEERAKARSKVRALLALAAGTSFPEEADAARRCAAKLTSRWGLAETG
jgi:hypothetical protein